MGKSDLINTYSRHIPPRKIPPCPLCQWAVTMRHQGANRSIGASDITPADEKRRSAQLLSDHHGSALRCADFVPFSNLPSGVHSSSTLCYRQCIRGVAIYYVVMCFLIAKFSVGCPHHIGRVSARRPKGPERRQHLTGRFVTLCCNPPPSSSWTIVKPSPLL